MLRSLFGFAWKKSPAHLLLLSKFLSTRSVEDFSGSDDWKAALREAPQKAIKRFLNEGMIERADLVGLLGYKYKVYELKKMLKQRGLPVSGRKTELIDRLVKADPEGMAKTVAGLNLRQCSKQGREITEQYLALEKQKRVTVERKVLDALQKHKFRAASQLVASYEADQVFPRGMGIDWKNHDPRRDVAVLNGIFGRKPKVLAQFNDRQFELLSITAGMKYLWGTIRAKDLLPPDEAELVRDNEAAVRAINSHALYLVQLSEFRKAGVKTVEIRNCNDSLVCEACRKLGKKKHKLDKVPELPYEKCTSEAGCRCWMVAADF